MRPHTVIAKHTLVAARSRWWLRRESSAGPSLGSHRLEHLHPSLRWCTPQVQDEDALEVEHQTRHLDKTGARSRSAKAGVHLFNSMSARSVPCLPTPSHRSGSHR